MEPSKDEGKRLYMRLVTEVLNGKNLGVIDEIIARDFVEHVAGEARNLGADGYKAARRRRNVVFPDWGVVVEDLLADGDKVVVRATGRGTHRGEFMGIPATGRHITITWIAIYRVANGKLAEHWINIDELGLLKQLGAGLSIPRP